MYTTTVPTKLELWREWLLKRGILFILTQTPMIALILGYFLRWIDFRTATAFTVILAFALLPIWVAFRKSRSNDPDEPVHHLHKYALYALVPYVVYNLARMPMHYLLQIVFWDHWYDFGYQLTGQPVDQWSSLIPGTFLHALQGYVLALGFYILYRRHSLLNALLYVWLFLSTIYTWTYPTFILVDYQPPLKWFFVVWWAHFWMALAVWFVPRLLYSPAFWGRFKARLARVAIRTLIVVLYFLPVTFVFWRAGTWQFTRQHEIDQATFNRAQIVLQDQVRIVPQESSALQPIASLGRPAEEASYQFTLRFGPRIYKDYINASKALDAGSVRVTGRLLHQGKIAGYCWAYVDMLETPNNILVPAEYFPALQRLEYTDIPVQCTGPANPAEPLGDQVEVRWSANMTLIGDRENLQRTFTGQGMVLASR